MEASQWDPKPALAHPEAFHHVLGIVYADRPSTIAKQLFVCPVFFTVEDSLQATLVLMVFVVLVNSRNVCGTVHNCGSLRGGMPNKVAVPEESA